MRLRVLLLGLTAGALYIAAGRSAPPRLTISKPDRPIGQVGALEVTAEAPNAKFTSLSIAVEQNGKTLPLFTLAGAQGAAPSSDASVTQVDRNQIRISRPLGKQSVPELQSGTARVTGLNAKALEAAPGMRILPVTQKLPLS